MIGLGRFVLQSYEKSDFEVEGSRTGYTARCMSRRMTKKAHQRQPSRRKNSCTQKEGSSQPMLFSHHPQALPLPARIAPCSPSHDKQEREKEEYKAALPSFNPTYLSFHHSRPIQESIIPTTATLVSARVPDVLEVAVPLGEAVHAVVALAHRAHEAAERVHLVLTSGAAVLVHLGDADLNGAVVLGLDDAVGRAALAGDVPAQRKRDMLVN